MSDNERLHVLVAIVDTHLAHQIIQKIRARFAQLPLDMNLVDDGRRALGEFQNRQPAIVIASLDLPNLDGAALAAEIRKRDGAVPVLFLKPESAPTPEGVEAITIPIVDWTEVTGKFQAAIPDDWKAKFGLFERNSALFKKLVTYGARYKTSVDAAPFPTNPLVCIPKFFDGSLEGTAIVSNRDADRSTETKLVYRELTDKQQKFVLRFELAILAVVTAVAFGVYLLKPEGDSFAGIKKFLIVITAISYFGFFVGRAVDRFVIKR